MLWLIGVLCAGLTLIGKLPLCFSYLIMLFDNVHIRYHVRKNESIECGYLDVQHTAL